MSACGCHPVQLAALIKRVAANVVKSVRDETIDADESAVLGSSFHCSACGQWVVISIVVTTLPHRGLAATAGAATEGAAPLVVGPFTTTADIYPTKGDVE